MKKRNWYIVLIVMLFGTTMVACTGDDDDDDDDNNTPLNMALEVAGTEYDLDKGILMLYGGDATDGYDNDIALVSSGIQYTIVNNDLDTIWGTGDMFYIECVTNSETEMSAGTYTYDTINYPKMTYYGAAYELNANVMDTVDNEVELVSGSFTVSKDGSDYVLGFDGKDENGNDVMMHYKGALTTVDWSKKKKK